MGQLNFAANIAYVPNYSSALEEFSVYYFAFNLYDNISFNTVNLAIASGEQAGEQVSISLGLYSLTASSLSMVNSIAGTPSLAVGRAPGYMSITATSATSNLTPGTWYWGLRLDYAIGVRTIVGAFSNNPENAFPGQFIGGHATNTSTLPSTVATSDLDITGGDALFVPYVIISA